MLVEDEPTIREGLKHYFDWKTLQYDHILEASNGLEGLNLAIEEKPDLIITDIRMPLMNGLDMIEQLRVELPSSLFVILTGYNEFSYAQRAISLGGVTEFLVKPLQYDVSLCAIERCTELLQHRKNGEAATAAGTGASLSIDPLNHSNRLDSSNDSDHSDSSRAVHPASSAGDDSYGGEDQLFQKIEQFIIEHIDQDISLPIVAERFFYNPSYLSRLFKQRLNKNYSLFQAEVRINYAKQCLAKPNNLVADVCAMCGYRSYKHFVKTFKQITDMTPTEYRKRLGLA